MLNPGTLSLSISCKLLDTFVVAQMSSGNLVSESLFVNNQTKTKLPNKTWTIIKFDLKRLDCGLLYWINNRFKSRAPRMEAFHLTWRPEILGRLLVEETKLIAFSGQVFAGDDQFKLIDSIELNLWIKLFEVKR